MTRLSAFIIKTKLMTPLLCIGLASSFWSSLSPTDLFSGDFMDFTNCWVAWFILHVLQLMRCVLCLWSLWNLFCFCRWIWNYVFACYSNFLFQRLCSFCCFWKLALYALSRYLCANWICLFLFGQWIYFFW